jgi:hypothetical protein
MAGPDRTVPRIRHAREAGGQDHWGEIKDALIAIAIFASLAVAVVVIRLVAFQPAFVAMLKQAARALATGRPL